MILGLAGRRATGKDSTYKIIKKLLPAWAIQRFAFADALKDFCHYYLGVPLANMHWDKGEKEASIGKWGDYFGNLKPDQYNVPIDARTVMQYVGTDVFRRFFRDDIWITTLFRQIDKFLDHTNPDFFLVTGIYDKKIAVVTDVRFPNECKAIRSYGNGKLVRLYRDTGLEHHTHPSEAALDSIPDSEFDHIISTEENKNLETLEKRIKEILKKENILR